MTLALTAAVETSPAGVQRVHLTISGATGSSPYVYRVEPSGNVVDVRGASPLSPFSPPSGVVLDYEAPFDTAVSYKVVDGATEATSGTVTVVSGGVPWLIHPGHPENSVPLSVLEWPTWKRPIETGVFQPIGRRLRVAVSARRSSPEGTLIVYTADATSRQAVEDVLADGSTLLLNGTSAENAGYRWVTVGETDEDPAEVDLREFVVWTLPLIEVDRPAGVSLPAATYSDASSTFASYGAVKAAEPTYADLVGGAWKG